MREEVFIGGGFLDGYDTEGGRGRSKENLVSIRVGGLWEVEWSARVLRSKGLRSLSGESSWRFVGTLMSGR